MHIGLLRVTAAAALFVCFACGTLAADAATYRSAPAPGWVNATHRSASRPSARLSGQRFARAPWYFTQPGPRGLSRATPPGATVLTRQFLDDIDARTLRDALRYVPGVIAR
jgi:outer membrane receptor for monomeric catechols